MKKAVVILPTYNEQENVTTLIPAIFASGKRAKGWLIHVLVVDDNSPDNTADAVRSLQKTYHGILHVLTGKKEGMGRAYQKGFHFAIEKLSPDVIFEMDADWQHDPLLIPKFLKKIDEGADFVIGSRYIKGGSIPQNWKLHRKFFSFFGNLVLRVGFMKFFVSDWTSGYRAIRTNFLIDTLGHYKNLDGYTFQIAIVDQAIKHGLVIKEVPLIFKDRIAGSSKINTPEFVIKNLLYIATESPFIKYVIVGFISAAIDFGVSYIFIEMIRSAVWVATVISGELSIIANFLMNNFWSFRHKKLDHAAQSYARGLLKFNIVTLISLVVQVVLLHYATEMLGVKYWYIYKALILGFVIVPYSYTTYNLIIWKSKKRKG